MSFIIEGNDCMPPISGGYLIIKIDGDEFDIVSVPSPILGADRHRDSVTENFDDIEECAESLFSQVVKKSGMVFQVNTLGGKINNGTRSKGSSYAHRNANYLGEAQFYWDKPEQMKSSLESMEKIQATLHANDVHQHYVNYPDLNIKNYESAYYGDSYKRLQKVKQRFDPENRFNYSQGIKPV